MMIPGLVEEDILVDPTSIDEIQTPGPGSYDNAHEAPGVEEWDEKLESAGPEFALEYWHQHMEYALAHRPAPIPLFDTEVIVESGREFHKVKTMDYGTTERTVLKRGEDFERIANHVGKAISLQYVVDSDGPVEEVKNEIPYDFPTASLQKFREAVSQCEAVWVRHLDAFTMAAKTPISEDIQLDGMLYYMYRENRHGGYLPLYIGVSQKMGRDGTSLNWNFAHITRDSVFGRWGYGNTQHLGGLSRAIFPDEYPEDPENKYELWKDALFHEGTLKLKSPVYIDMVPYFDADVTEAEEIMIKVASKVFDHPSLDSDLYGHELLNNEYAE